MTHRTLWEEGHQPGHRVVVLGVAVALTVTAVDLLAFDRVTVLFDLCFVLLCVGLALLVRPADFFTVAVLAPPLMAGVFLLLGATRPEVIADAGDGAVQALVTGLGHHAGALVAGYLLSLAVLGVRYRVLERRRAGEGPRPSRQDSKRPGSPAPTRTTSG